MVFTHCRATLPAISAAVLSHSSSGTGSGHQSAVCVRIDQALTNSAKSAPTTARNTLRPIFAVGTAAARAPAGPSVTPTSSHGFELGRAHAGPAVLMRIPY